MDNRTILCKISYAANQMSQAAIAGYWDDERCAYHIDRLREEFKRLVELMKELE